MLCVYSKTTPSHNNTQLSLNNEFLKYGLTQYKIAGLIDECPQPRQEWKKRGITWAAFIKKGGDHGQILCTKSGSEGDIKQEQASEVAAKKMPILGSYSVQGTVSDKLKVVIQTSVGVLLFVSVITF